MSCRLGVVGMDHLHLFELVQGLVDAGAETVAHVPDGEFLGLYEGWRSDSRPVEPAKLLAEAELAKRMRAVDAKTQFHLLDDGAWWEVKLAKIPPRQAYVDVVRRAKLSKLSVGTLYDREGVYAHDKRQLSKAEMKLLKLRWMDFAAWPRFSPITAMACLPVSRTALGMRWVTGSASN